MTLPALPDAPGTYLLVLRAERVERVTVGALGEMDVRPGWYLYAGSAFGPGGLRARAGRHFAGSGALRWHIDYLRRVTRPVEAWVAEGQACEHAWAQSLARAADCSIPLARFGASDCRCPAHLFYLPQQPDPVWLMECLKTDNCKPGQISITPV